MKNLRQEAILKIIEEQPVFTQEMLVSLLQKQGWNVHRQRSHVILKHWGCARPQTARKPAISNQPPASRPSLRLSMPGPY